MFAFSTHTKRQDCWPLRLPHRGRDGLPAWIGPPGPSGHKVFCVWPHSLQAYSTRSWPTSAVTRLGAPHLLHFTSSRVLPCVMVTFRAIASLTKRSDSWRMASFDIAGARGFHTINSSCPKKPVCSLFSHRAQIASFRMVGVERLT